MQIQMLEEMVDKEIKHNEALAERVVGFMKKEWKEKTEWEKKKESSKKKEVSPSKNEATKDMVSRRSDEGQGCCQGCPLLEEIVLQGLPLQVITLDVYLLFDLCVINLVNMMHAYM
jgi:hypothetical protein